MVSGSLSASSKMCIRDSLSPDAQRALSRFDMTLPTDVLVSPQIFTVKTMDLETGRTAHYQRCYLNMDRARFDRWLMDAMPDLSLIHI